MCDGPGVNDMKILHTADWHLDSPMRGLDRYSAAPNEAVRNTVRTALENLVQLAVSEQASLVLMAGDLFDGDWRDFHTALYLNKQLARLKDAGVRTVIAGGNQDAAGRLFAVMRPAEGTRVLSADKAETVVFEDLGVAVHGRSFKTADVSEDPTPSYPAPLRGFLNIGMLHTSAEGCAGHAVFAPCRVSSLAEKGYEYWALGHDHARRELSREPWIVHSGAIQGRSIAEPGPHGCTLITVQDGRIASVEHRDTDVLRWGVCEVDITEAPGGEEVLERFGRALTAHIGECGGRLPIVRVRLVGRGAAHRTFSEKPDDWQDEFRSAAHELAGDKVWIERVVFATTEEALEDKLRSDEALGGLAALIDRICADDDQTERLVGEFAALRDALSEELAKDAGDCWNGREPIRRALQDVKHLLIPRLLSLGGSK